MNKLVLISSIEKKALEGIGENAYFTLFGGKNVMKDDKGVYDLIFHGRFLPLGGPQFLAKTADLVVPVLSPLPKKFADQTLFNRFFGRSPFGYIAETGSDHLNFYPAGRDVALVPRPYWTIDDKDFWGHIKGTELEEYLQGKIKKIDHAAFLYSRGSI